MRHGGGRYKNWEMSNTKSRLTGRGGRSALSEGELQKAG